VRNVESVALSVLRVIEEDAMKRGVEKIIAHLPIECAAFLLNEKRSVIERLENRLKVGIVILPCKHLETPAYEVEIIRERDYHEEKASYSQLKTETVSVPDFVHHAKQHSQTAKPAAVTEFMHDSPAPTLNKNEAATLIKRFWTKLAKSISSNDDIGVLEIDTPLQIDSESSVTASPAVQIVKSKNNRRNKNQRNQKRSKERDVKAVTDSENNNVTDTELVIENIDNEFVEVDDCSTEKPIANSTETIELNDVSADAALPVRKNKSRNNLRRGPNRRRPRNPDYKKSDVSVQTEPSFAEVSE